MARGAQKQAGQLFDQSQAVGGKAGGNADSLYNQLFPIYSQEASDPQGFGAHDMADMTTAGEQATGGATSSIVGQGNLDAARTRNVGGFQNLGDQMAREKMQTDSENAVNIKGQNAKLKQAQQQSGISGLSGLRDSNVSELMQSMGLGNEAVNTELKAGNSGWLQNFMNLMQTFKAGGSSSMMSGAGATG